MFVEGAHFGALSCLIICPAQTDQVEVFEIVFKATPPAHKWLLGVDWLNLLPLCSLDGLLCINWHPQGGTGQGCAHKQGCSDGESTRNEPRVDVAHTSTGAW